MAMLQHLKDLLPDLVTPRRLSPLRLCLAKPDGVALVLLEQNVAFVHNVGLRCRVVSKIGVDVGAAISRLQLRRGQQLLRGLELATAAWQVAKRGGPCGKTGSK